MSGCPSFCDLCNCSCLIPISIHWKQPPILAYLLKLFCFQDATSNLGSLLFFKSLSELPPPNRLLPISPVDYG